MSLTKLLPIIFFISIFIIFLLPLADNDFGWHFRCGQKILEQGKICTGSEFQYFLHGYKWANPNFLYDILSAVIFNNLGFFGLSILGSLIFTLIIYVLYKSNRLNPAFKIPIIYLAILLSWQVLGLGFRSQIVSLLFLLLTIQIIFKTKQGNHQRLFWLIPLFLIWANTHPGFFLGPLVFGVFVLSKIIDLVIDRIGNQDLSIYPKNRPILSFPRKRESRIQYPMRLHLDPSRKMQDVDDKNDKSISFKNKELLFISFIFLISVLVTLANPFGWHIYEEVYHHFKTPLNTLIAEWTAPNIWHIILIILTNGVSLIYSVWTKKLSLFSLIMLIIFALFAIKARRNLPIYYFYLAFLCLNYLKINLNKRLNNILQRFLIFIIIPLIIFLGPYKIASSIEFNTNHSTYCNSGYVKYPCQAVKFIREFNQDKNLKNIFNTYEWGGFLLWQLPKMNVFIDGRMPAWQGENNESPYLTWLKILQTRDLWQERLEFYKTDYIFISPGTFLDLKLQESPKSYGYREIYRDNKAVIYMSLKSH